MADTLLPRYARGFRLLRYPDSTVVEVLGNAGEITARMCSLEDKADLRLACMSTTHASMLAALGLSERIAGMAFADRALDTLLIRAVDRGSIADLGQGSSESLEQLLLLKPDIYFIYPYETDAARYAEAGLTIFPVSEYLEQSPLARAEWLLCLGALCGRHYAADSLFRDIEREYLEAKAVLSEKRERPEVFAGGSYEGQWYAPGGKSLIARFIEDAGGRYSFADYASAENLNLEFETLIAEASDADYWGDVRFGDTGSAEASGMLSRMQGFRAVQSHNLFYCDASRWDYFGRGVIEPQIILKDLGNILHPGSFPEHSPAYFRMDKP